MTTRDDLVSKTCIPCKGDIPPLKDWKISEMMNIVTGWKLITSGPDKIEKSYKFEDFKESMKFVNEVAELAEKEGHHPDISIHWNKVTLTLWTHAIDGLHENDFIMAAKIDDLLDDESSE
ncbi:MAG: 4a-hydroxytetrahydrobiopterin dehydratase [Candidatus Lokiarchaeota archaeon]|nr:4a-hydroxytetrahydrobiopterin dehydratase [Candidatus Lokiarchaeota archaeon]